MKIDLNTILIIAGFAILILFSQSEPTNTNTVIKELETKVHDTTIYVNTIKDRISKIDLSGIENKIDSLIQLRLNTRDTLTIIKIQDTIIYNQTNIIDTLKVGIKERDTIIAVQDYTIQAKDSIITLERIKIKKKNKDIIKMALVSLGIGVIAILK